MLILSMAFFYKILNTSFANENFLKLKVGQCIKNKYTMQFAYLVIKQEKENMYVTMAYNNLYDLNEKVILMGTNVNKFHKNDYEIINCPNNIILTNKTIEINNYINEIIYAIKIKTKVK